MRGAELNLAVLVLLVLVLLVLLVLLVILVALLAVSNLLRLLLLLCFLPASFFLTLLVLLFLLLTFVLAFLLYIFLLWFSIFFLVLREQIKTKQIDSSKWFWTKKRPLLAYQKGLPYLMIISFFAYFCKKICHKNCGGNSQFVGIPVDSQHSKMKKNLKSSNSQNSPHSEIRNPNPVILKMKKKPIPLKVSIPLAWLALLPRLWNTSTS